MSGKAILSTVLMYKFAASAEACCCTFFLYLVEFFLSGTDSLDYIICSLNLYLRNLEEVDKVLTVLTQINNSEVRVETGY